ncbi:MAG: N-glycosylase/DNA lyase [Candidatus Absconditabacteria bacterium]
MKDNKLINEMKLYLKGFDNENIFELEKTKDKQFIALEKLRNRIKCKNNVNEFLYLIIQNSLVSYQLSGSGESRWEEFAIKCEEYFAKENNNENRRKNILLNCKNNCRLNQMKLKRIQKINSKIQDFDELIKFENNQDKLLEILGKTMNQDTKSKTIVFAIKMYVYGIKIIKNKNIEYSNNIGIPVDSRLEKIYYYLNGTKNVNKNQIYIFFIDLAKDLDICPLGLDSILWIDYWHKFKDLIIKK